MNLLRFAFCASVFAVATVMQACSPSGSQQGYSTTALATVPTVVSLRKLRVGGFDEARGGSESLQDPDVAGLRSAIASGVKGATFRFTGQLNSHLFSRINAVVLGVLVS